MFFIFFLFEKTAEFPLNEESAAEESEEIEDADKEEAAQPTKIEVKNAENIEDIKEIEPEENKASMIDVQNPQVQTSFH